MMITVERVHRAYLAAQRMGVHRKEIGRIYARAHLTEFLDDSETHLVEYIEALEKQKNEQRARSRNVRHLYAVQ